MPSMISTETKYNKLYQYLSDFRLLLLHEYSEFMKDNFLKKNMDCTLLDNDGQKSSTNIY